MLIASWFVAPRVNELFSLFGNAQQCGGVRESGRVALATGITIRARVYFCVVYLDSLHTLKEGKIIKFSFRPPPPVVGKRNGSGLHVT